MNWFKRLFQKKTPEQLSFERQEEPDMSLTEVETWIPVWHGWGQWDNGMWLSYTIFYSPELHNFDLVTRGFRAEEHGTYHKIALPNLFRVQRTLFQFSPEDIIGQIVENNQKEADQIMERNSWASVNRMSDEEIEDRIQRSIDNEDYREAARLQKELDKRRGI